MTRFFAMLAAALLIDFQQPTFKAGVELVAVDVHVVDRQGRPVVGLKAEDFEVQIAGDRRTVASAELISYDTTTGATAASVNPDATATTAAPRPRRMFILAVDEHSLHISNAMAAVNAAERFIDKLQPDDLVGLCALTGVAMHDLTNDHAAVRREVRKITGLYSEPMSRFNLSPSEAIAIASGDREMQLQVVRRECASQRCDQRQVQDEAISFAGTIEMRISQSLGGLRGLVRGLEAVPGRKTLVMVSGGLILTDQGMGRANAHAEIASVARDVARANISLFALHLDWSFLETLSSRGGLRLSYFRDSNMAASGLEMIAGSTGGAVFRVQGTSPDVAFDRVLRETSAYYLLGVEVAAADRDGEVKQIRVQVDRRGTSIRSRTTVLVPKPAAAVRKQTTVFVW